MKTEERQWEGGTTNNITTTECSSCCTLELRAARAESVIYCGFVQVPPAS